MFESEILNILAAVKDLLALGDLTTEMLKEVSELLDVIEVLDQFMHPASTNINTVNHLTIFEEEELLRSIINVIELSEIVITLDEIQSRRPGRRWGVHPINQLRREQGHFNHLYQEMILNDHDKFFNYTRMFPSEFNYLLSMIAPHITKVSSNAIPAECRLLLTLRFLATGDSLKSMHYNYRVGVSTAKLIIDETCATIWNVLYPIYLKFPTEDDWKHSAQEFKHKLNFPNCVGAIDGKHIQITAAPNSGTMYFNYLKTFSVVLLAVCDVEKKFLYVDIGAYGGQSDGGILINSTLGKRLDSKSLNLPPPTVLPGTNLPAPFFIIGDAAFPLKENLQKPYGGRNLDPIKDNYNTRLNSVRKVIENAFGILAKRWRIFMKPIEAQPKYVDNFIKAAVVLHNFIKSFNNNLTERYMSVDDNVIENTAFQNISMGARNSTVTASVLRDNYAQNLYQNNQ